MSVLAPPPPAPPPTVGLGDRDDHHRRLRMRLTQLTATAVTVIITAWICTFGPIPAVIALVTAKHVLVAILLMGMGMGDVYPRQPAAPDE